MPVPTTSAPLRLLLACFALAAGAARADVVVIDPSQVAAPGVDPLRWSPANVRANGAIAITTASSPPGDGGGAIQMDTVNPPIVSGQDKADVEIFFSDPGLVLGDLDALAFAWLRASTSTVAAHFSPVFRIHFQTAGGQTGMLIWEAVYQTQYGGAMPTDVWVDEDILAGRFWMRAAGPGRTIDVYNLTLADWIAAGAVSDGVDTGWDIDADTRVIGINLGFGSGWGGGEFHGFVDAVTLGFDGDETTWDFDFVNSLLCPAVPALDCMSGTAPERAVLGMRVPEANAARKRLRFISRRGDSCDPSDFGDPRVDTDYQLCVWSIGPGGTALVADPLAPAGEGWSTARDGYRFKRPVGANPDGLRRIRLRAGEEGKSRVRVQGKGPGLELPALPLAEDEALVVQLHNGIGRCWEASFDAAPRANTPTLFRSRGQ
jgi:hypothetical protein